LAICALLLLQESRSRGFGALFDYFQTLQLEQELPREEEKDFLFSSFLGH